MNPNFLRKSEVIFHEGSRVVELQVDGYNPRSFRTSDLTQCFPEITLLTVLSFTPVEQKKGTLDRVPTPGAFLYGGPERRRDTVQLSCMSLSRAMLCLCLCLRLCLCVSAG